MGAGYLGGSFVLFLIIGLPIAVLLGIISFVPNMVNPWFPADMEYIVRAMLSGVNSFPILAVPMFILSGNIMAKGKISERLFDFFAFFVAKKRAGLPMAVVMTCLFYGAISGSGPATTAAVGAMTIPILTKVGYKKEFSASLVAVAGGIGVIIPPSIPFIFYGQAAGVSVSDLFIAGIIPGIMIGLALMVYSYYYCVKNGEDRKKLDEYGRSLRQKGFLNMVRESFLALLCPIIVLGSIYSGVASPTEAAVISVFYSLFVSMVAYKSIGFRELWNILVESAGTYSTILFVIACAVAFSRVLIFMQIPDMVVSLISSSVNNKYILLLVVNILLLFVGMVMDTTPAIMILTPILLSIMMKFGISQIHFGIIMVVNLAIGFVTPPLGVNLFVASTVTGIRIEKIVRGSIPFIVAFVIVLAIITMVPQISTILL